MSKAILKSLALLGALAVSGAAYASPVLVSQQTNNINKPSAGATYGTVTASVTKSNWPKEAIKDAKIGAFALRGDGGPETEASVSGNFVAFCVDIFDTINGKLPSNYNVLDNGSFLAGITSTALDNVQKLFNTAYSTVSANLNDAKYSAGFQMALWEVLYETKSTLSVKDGKFSIGGSSSAKTYADMILGNLNNGSDAAGYQVYDLTFLQSANEKGDSQDLITASLAPSPAPVPAPAAGLLLLAGLAGLGALARRRKDA